MRCMNFFTTYFAVQGHRFWYQSKAHIRLPVYQDDSSLEFMNLLQNYHLAVIEYLYRGRRAVPLQTFTTRHSNRKVSIVMALSTTFTQCAQETTKFGKITQDKGHFAVQCHRFWYHARAGQSMTSCRLQSNCSSTVTLHDGPVEFRPIRATPCYFNFVSASHMWN